MKQSRVRKYDLVIAGGGLAGAALAIAAAGRGLSVALVEAHAVDAFASGEPERVIALSFGSRTYMERLGVWDAIEALGVTPIRRVRVAEPGNRGEVRMHHAESGVDALGYVVRNAHVLRALYAAMPDNVRIIAPARVRSLDYGDNSVRISAVRDGGTVRLSGRLLVGADGTNSQIRRLCGITSFGWDHNRFGLVASVRTDMSRPNAAYECFRASGPLAFLPLEHQCCSIVWTLTPREASRIMAMDNVDFLRELQVAAGKEIRERLGHFSSAGARACFPFEFRMAACLTAPRMALIGNAAHTVHPVAGQGLNLGLRDVAALDDILGRTLAGKRDIGAPVALEEYRQQRKPDNMTVAAFTEGLNTIFANEFLPMKLARGAGLLAMQQISPIRSWLMRRAAGLARMASLDHAS